MDEIYSIYNQFLNYFPANLHGVVSVVLALLIVIAIFKVLKHQFIYLILLVVLLPASVPILEGIWQSLLNLLKFLINNK